ncbi:MAG: carboxypeptidase regulatory-like domain-containing protein, partial [Blastocatellia bacterium]
MYEIDYVRNGDCGPVVVSSTNPATGSEKRLSTALTFNGQHMVIDLVFLARGGVQGLVTIQGAPAPNAFVRVTPVLDVTGSATVQADASGNYVVNDIPVGDVSVFAVGAGSQSNATGLAAGNVPGPGQIGTVNVSLQSLAGVVKGSVVHFDQSPVVGALVVASFLFPGHADLTPVGFSFTDRSGNFVISNLPVGAISISATDYVTGVRVTTNLQLTTALPEVDGTVLTLPGNGSISGKVTDDGGAFISGAIVLAAGNGVVADALGNYTLTNLPAGTLTVSAADPTTLQTGSTQVTVVIGQTISNVNIVITRAASLNGHVYLMDASGNKTPVANATVTADGVNQVQTNSTGAYSLGNVGTNGVVVRAVHPNNILAANSAVALGPGEVLTRDLVFHVASIHGKVVQPDGTPVVAQLSIATPLPDLQTGPNYGLLSTGQPVS